MSSSVEMPVFCDVSPEEQINGLRRFFIARQAKLKSIGNDDVNESLNELINNLQCLFTQETSDIELEMVLNSILSLIVFAPEDRITKLVEVFCDGVVKAALPERYHVVKLRVLSNLYYGLMQTSRDRYYVYISLAKCTLSARNLQYLPSNLDQIKRCLVQWQVKTSESQVLLRVLFEALSLSGDSQNALKVMSELLSTFSKENATQARDDAQKCMIYCVNDANIFIMDGFLALEPIKALEGQLIHQLFTIFTSGKLQQYTEFYEKNKEFIEKSGTNHERNINKMRILTFMSLGESSKVVSFDLLQKQLQINSEEVESFLIDAIRSKNIRCKIDQLGRTVTISSVSYRTFNKQHWQLLKDKLEKWKENLLMVNQNLSNLLAQPNTIQVA